MGKTMGDSLIETGARAMYGRCGGTCWEQEGPITQRFGYLKFRAGLEAIYQLPDGAKEELWPHVGPVTQNARVDTYQQVIQWALQDGQAQEDS